MSSYRTLILSAEERVATITFNRPDKRNAVSYELIEELAAALEQVRSSGAQVLIITGAGKAFCAGMDLENLKGLLGRTHEQNVEDSRKMASLFRSLYDFPLPTIAAVNGAAIAGGTGIATICDFTLAVPEAKFGYTEVKIGFVPAIVSTFLTRQVGEKIARDLLLTGRLFDAAEAKQIGLVHEVISPEQLLSRAHELAQLLLANSPASLRATKQLLSKSVNEELDRLIEGAIEENARIRQGHDFREGITAFLEKRNPVWDS
jgi:methylglutaconyl-CoA hydratase